MIRSIGQALALLLCLLQIAGISLAGELGADPAQGERSGQWVVVLDDPRPARQRGWSSGVGYQGGFDYTASPRLTRLAASIERDYAVKVTEQWPILGLGVHCLVVEIQGPVDATIAAVEADARVRWVKPLNTFEGVGSTRASQQEEPYRHLQPALDVLNVAPLHAHYSGAGVAIALIDSAVEVDHPELSHAVVEQIDLVETEKVPAERHGTGIAGVLVAAPENGIGIEGVAPGARVHAFRGCWELDTGQTRCGSLTLSRALDQALLRAPDLVNLSLTGPRDRLLDELVKRLVAGGALVIAARGSRDPHSRRFPSPGPGVLLVRDGSAVTRISEGALYAPGHAVLTAQPGHSYDFMSGASLAAAHVSGVLALMFEAHPKAPAELLASRLHHSMRVTEQGSSIDACRAVATPAAEFSCNRALEELVSNP